MESKNIVVMILIAAIFTAGCTGQAQTATTTENAVTKVSLDVEKVEVYHFHGTNQCYSCKTVGAYAEETISTYFADEVKSGKIIFGHINAELAENIDLVEKYGATGSSLWIGTYTKDGQFRAEQNANVWYKIGNKDEYLSYLKGVIEQKFAGN